MRWGWVNTSQRGQSAAAVRFLSSRWRYTTIKDRRCCRGDVYETHYYHHYQNHLNHHLCPVSCSSCSVPAGSCSQARGWPQRSPAEFWLWWCAWRETWDTGLCVDDVQAGVVYGCVCHWLPAAVSLCVKHGPVTDTSGVINLTATSAAELFNILPIRNLI